MSRHDDGRFGFVAIELEANTQTADGFEHALEQAVHIAERGCLVARALETPVHVTCKVSTAAPVA